MDVFISRQERSVLVGSCLQERTGQLCEEELFSTGAGVLPGDRASVRPSHRGIVGRPARCRQQE